MLTHKGTVVLTTPRLILRRCTMDDAQPMFDNWASDERVTKYLSWDIHESVEITKRLLPDWIEQYDNLEYYHWGIQYEGTIVGTINFHSIANKSEHLELGYCIGSKWWNKGIVTEAVKELIRFAFEELNAHKVYAFHDTENAASGKVMLKSGMVQEALFREHALRKNGTRGDMAGYAIINSI